MIGYLLDTTIAIAIMQAHERVAKIAGEHIAAGAAAISTCSVGELYCGVHTSTKPEDERRAVEELLATLEIIDYEEVAAREFGRLRAVMQRQGLIVPTMDTQIAAIAIVNGLTVVSFDRHFTLIPDLPVENWLEP